MRGRACRGEVANQVVAANRRDHRLRSCIMLTAGFFREAFDAVEPYTESLAAYAAGTFARGGAPVCSQAARAFV